MCVYKTNLMKPISSRPSLRPWAIVAFIPEHKPKAIARLCNRTDAEDHCRFLQQRIPKTHFSVIYDPDESIDFLHEQHKT